MCSLRSGIVFLVFIASFLHAESQAICARNITAAAVAGQQCERPCNQDGSCRKDNRECVCDGYCGWICKKKTCPPPDQPEHGEFIIEPPQGYIGAIITYSCNEGYAPTGNNQRTCLPNKEWDGSNPTCRRPCDPLDDPVNGIIWYSDGQRWPGTTAFYQCYRGYSVSGLDRPLRTCQSDGTWTGFHLTCTSIEVNGGWTEWSKWSACSETCSEGRETRQRSCTNPTPQFGGQDCTGSTENVRVCQSQRSCPACPPPDQPEHGEFIIEPPQGYIGAIATYSCNEGYVLTGNGQRTCLPNNAWGGSNPTCRRPCDPLDGPVNGIIRYSDEQRWPGTTALYQCNSGYSMSGLDHPIRTCQSDGTWTGYHQTCTNIEEIPEEIVIPFVNLTVIVVDNGDEYGDPLQPAALVRVMVRDPSEPSGTRVFREARTGDDGMVIMDCPHNESVIITAKIQSSSVFLFSNSVTFRCNIDQTNVVTLPLHRPYEDAIYVYHPDSPREFGIGNETRNERYRTFFPQDMFDIPDNRRVQLLFRSVNVSVPEELEFAPEMIACIPENSGPIRGDVGRAPLSETAGPIRGDVGRAPLSETDSDIRAIEAYGAIELTVKDVMTKRAPPFKSDRQMQLTFPIQKLPDDLSFGDTVPAWTFDFNKGCWNKDGDGELVIDKYTGNLVWEYEADHFSWWAAGRVNPKTSCVNVRTCYDAACNRPAPDTLVGMFGSDYGFESFRYTNLAGFVCIQFPFGRTLRIFSPCSGASGTVMSTENPSSCGEGETEIPSVPLSQLLGAQDPCRQVTLVVPEYDRTCISPVFIHNNLLLKPEYLGRRNTRYSYSDTVQYDCRIYGDLISGDGVGYRHCDRCYRWAGDLECEEGGSESYSSF